MTPDEILQLAAEERLSAPSGSDPFTVRKVEDFLAIGDHVAMPLDGVSWSISRQGQEDLPILDELGAELGTLCLLSHREPLLVAEMTSWQYAAYLSECEVAEVSDSYRFARDFAVINFSDLERYRERYMSGSALWAGYHHGTSSAELPGWRTTIQARPGISPPTSHHQTGMLQIARAAGPREHFLKLYHQVELLFDLITYRQFRRVNADLEGFGDIMANFKRQEVDRLKGIIKDYCEDEAGLAGRLMLMEPHLALAEPIFQQHSKESNPLSVEKWERYVAVMQTSGQITAESLVSGRVIGKSTEFRSQVGAIAAYHIYRVRSSIAHSRIGEHVLKDEDDELIAKYAIPLMEEVAMQILGGQAFRQLMEDPAG